MRRPDIELSDEAAAYVERHPDLIARLAGQTPFPGSGPGALTGAEATEFAARRARIRGRLRHRLGAVRSGETRGAGQAFLAKYTA